MCPVVSSAVHLNLFPSRALRNRLNMGNMGHIAHMGKAAGFYRTGLQTWTDWSIKGMYTMLPGEGGVGGWGGGQNKQLQSISLHIGIFGLKAGAFCWT